MGPLYKCLYSFTDSKIIPGGVFMIQRLVEFGFIGFPVNELLEALTDRRVLPAENMANHKRNHRYCINRNGNRIVIQRMRYSG